MNLTDTIQHWLQGQINAAIDGVLARLDGLERHKAASYVDLNNLNTQLHRVNVDLTNRIEGLEHGNDSLERRLTELEIENSNLVNTNLALERQVQMLEELNIDDQITGLRMENDRLLSRIDNGVRKLAMDMADLEAQNNALREELAYVKNNVKAFVQNDPCDSEVFSDRVRDIIADYMANEDNLVRNYHMNEILDRYFDESSFKIKAR